MTGVPVVRSWRLDVNIGHGMMGLESGRGVVGLRVVLLRVELASKFFLSKVEYNAPHIRVEIASRGVHPPQLLLPSSYVMVVKGASSPIGGGDLGVASLEEWHKVMMLEYRWEGTC